MTGNESTECFSHQDLQKPRIEKHMADVNAFVGLMESTTSTEERGGLQS